MYTEPERKIPLHRAIGYVVLSVCIIWGSLIGTWLVHKAVLQKRQLDARYTIAAIVQTCPQKERLQSWQLAEMLNLSRDKPQNLYAFDPAAATATLLACPAIKKASIRRQPPSIVHIDYVFREPCALLADFSNVALDRERVCFPLKPYFTPKRLPELYLGIRELSYNSPLETKEASLAFKVLDYAKSSLPSACRIVRIDTHNAFAKSAGVQEVVVVLEEASRTRYLRLAPQTFQKSLDTFIAYQSVFNQVNSTLPDQIIDLRSPCIALVK